jgi:hypothetical protein
MDAREKSGGVLARRGEHDGIVQSYVLCRVIHCEVTRQGGLAGLPGAVQKDHRSIVQGREHSLRQPSSL